MKKVLVLLFLCVTMAACQKGEPVNFSEYMAMDMEVYCEDTSLFVEAAFNDTSFYSDATFRPGGEVFTLYTGSPAEIARPTGDSGRLTLTIIKKNNANLVFDSIISVKNYNDFLLVELDPSQRPYLIDKQIASATISRPTPDSIKVRFYFSSRDPNIRNANYSPARIVSSMDIELWTTREVDGVSEPVNTGRKIRVRADQLSEEYFTLSKNDQYAWRLLDVSSGIEANKRVIETYEYDDGFGVFTRGYIEFGHTDVFQTYKITQTFETLYSFQYGINGKFLFGFE